MIPREPTTTLERVVIEDLGVWVDERDPNALVGAVRFLALDSGRRVTASLCFRRGDAEALLRLEELRRCAHPTEPGRTPPPTLDVTLAVELDLSLRLVAYRRRGEEEGGDGR